MFIRYDTIRDAILTCARKATRVSLIYRTEPITSTSTIAIVYVAIIKTKVIARVHPVHLMNEDWAPGWRQPSDQANRLGLWVYQKLAATVHIHHRHCYYYSTYKLVLIYRPTEDWVDVGTAVKVRSPFPRLYSAAAVAVNTHRPHSDSNLGPLTIVIVWLSSCWEQEAEFAHSGGDVYIRRW